MSKLAAYVVGFLAAAAALIGFGRSAERRGERKAQKRQKAAARAVEKRLEKIDAEIDAKSDAKAEAIAAETEKTVKRARAGRVAATEINQLIQTTTDQDK